MKNEKRGIGFCFFPPEGMVQGSRSKDRGTRFEVRDKHLCSEIADLILNFDF